MRSFRDEPKQRNKLAFVTPRNRATVDEGQLLYSTASTERGCAIPAENSRPGRKAEGSKLIRTDSRNPSAYGAIFEDENPNRQPIWASIANVYCATAWGLLRQTQLRTTVAVEHLSSAQAVSLASLVRCSATDEHTSIQPGNAWMASAISKYGEMYPVLMR